MNYRTGRTIRLIGLVVAVMITATLQAAMLSGFDTVAQNATLVHSVTCALEPGADQAVKVR
jgi:hypothetical protein